MRMASARPGRVGCIVSIMRRLTPPCVASTNNVLTSGLARSATPRREFMMAFRYLALSSDSEKGPDITPSSKSLSMAFRKDPSLPTTVF